MTEHQYRVVACKNTEPHGPHTFRGQYQKRSLPGVQITETFQCEGIEHPVPTTEMTAMSHETTGFCFCGQMHGQVKDWNEYDWAALRTHQPAPQPPTREQIAEATEAFMNAQDANEFHWKAEGRRPLRTVSVRAGLQAAFALLQKGGER